jgi:heavy metal translocating P-type ATPase
LQAAGGEGGRCAHCGLSLSGLRPAPAYCCYGCRLVHQLTGARAESGEYPWVLARLLIGVFFSMLAMVFAVPLYSDAIYGAGAAGEPMGPLTPLFRWLTCAASLPVLGLLGAPIARNALRGGSGAAVDLLILTGVLAAVAASAAHLALGAGQIYFETASMLLVFLTAGRAIEAAGKAKAAGALQGLIELCPKTARRLREGAGDDGLESAADDAVPTEAIQPGDRVRILPGERLPVDGRVLAGGASIDRSLVTGESALELRAPGDLVHAGTLSVDGALIVEASCPAGERLIDRVVAYLEEARRRRGRLDRLADRLARLFLPLAIGTALAALGFWWPRIGALDAGLRALATLLIACPCALGIATPLAAWRGIRAAARRGVLVRGGEVFEVLARGGLMAFDKTGTLTLPGRELGRLRPFDGADERDLVAVGGALGRLSTHPASQAIAREAARRGAPLVPVRCFRAHLGQGVEAETPRGRALLGSRRFVLGELTRLHGDAPELRRARDGGFSSRDVLVSLGDRLLGGFEIEERLRDEAPAAVAALAALGFDCAIVSGDAAERVDAAARALGVGGAAELSPMEKVEWLRGARGRYPAVAMVGDGINDAPVLAGADAGIALGSGVDLAQESAGAVLLGDLDGRPLEALPHLVRIARRAVRRMRFNLVWALGYNALGMGFAAAGWVHPLFAALLMALSSLFVTGAALDREGS